MSWTTPTIDEVGIGMDATSHPSAGTSSLRVVILYSFSVEYSVPSLTGALKE